MEIRRVVCKSGNEYNIVNETWESYTYQTCMSGLLNSILENDFKNYITREKENNGIARLTKGKKSGIRTKVE